MMKYVLGIDQSTQGTKTVLVDEVGRIVGRAYRSHRQIINEKGWVSHDLEEIYQNVIFAVKDVVEKTGICKEAICTVGISNQRETTAIWNRTGKPLNDAVVWQCARAKNIVDDMSEYRDVVNRRTGIPLSPYFPAAKMAWLLKNTDYSEDICLGTIDTWLVYRLTYGMSYKTDYSNASRTQLFNIQERKWDKEICKIFEISMEYLPEVVDSNDNFGLTDFEGFLEKPIPIHCVMGDSHAALFGQGCHDAGMIKTTYGTGSSIMMNTGDRCVKSKNGLVTSLAWSIDGKAEYVLEGNINYTGAVISWLKDEMGIISSPAETAEAAKNANLLDETVLVPAFSGLSAPYWNNSAKAMLYGMSRTTGKNEVIRAALDSIAYQIEAVLDAMSKDSGMKVKELRVDGGPTRNTYLMQLQSDLSDVQVSVPNIEELSAFGVVCMAGMANGIYTKDSVLDILQRTVYCPQISLEDRKQRIHKWQNAIRMVMQQSVIENI